MENQINQICNDCGKPLKFPAYRCKKCYLKSVKKPPNYEQAIKIVESLGVMTKDQIAELRNVAARKKQPSNG